MKARSILPCVLLGLTLCLNAGDETPAPVSGQAAAKADDLSSFKTADALWAHVQELRQEPKVQPKSREELIGILKSWLGNQKAAVDAFVAAYPKDPRFYAAKLASIQVSMQMAQIPGGDSATSPKPEVMLKELDTIIAAADAPEEVKGEATFFKLVVGAGQLEDKPEGLAAFVKDSDEFLAKFAKHKLAPQMRQIQLQIAEQVQTAEGEALLKKLAASADATTASAAKEMLVKREKTAALKSKPLELKFTATDGKEVDVAKLRGKVVLVDFWASWCGPCIAEMPNVVSTYKKLHDKGFEIVGVSLDQKKSAMEAAIEKHGMTWPQYFDGKGWENTISSGFGIESIPAAWLLDKKGMLRETGLRGEALAAAVEKLLAE